MNPAFVASNMEHKTDLSGYLARLPRKYELAYRVKWCLDDSCRSGLWGYLLQEAMRLSTDGDWPLKKGKHYLDKMCHLAITELMTTIPADNWHVRATSIGVGKTQWYKVWREKYEQVYGIANDWTNTAFRHVKRMQDE